MTKRYFLTCITLITTLVSMAQSDSIFNRTIYNSDYNIYLVMNFYDKDVTIRGQEYMGKMDGYLGDYDDFRKWLITDSEITDGNIANMVIVNLEGSEDLRATLVYNTDGTYTLKQGHGSSIKIARRQKWVKLPKNITFTTTREKSKKN